MKKKKNETEIIYETEATKIQKKRKKRKKRRIIIASVLILLLALVVIRRKRNAKNRKKGGIGATPVQVMKTRKGNVSRILRVNGEIQAKYGASIFSDVSGRIRAIFKREGAFVAKGTPLATIDRRSSGVDYLDFVVRSPIAGVVGNVDVEIGYTIGPTTQLMKVVNPRFMECIVNLVEKDIGIIKEGLPAFIKVDAYPNKVFTGYISNISTIVHPLSRTVQARILIDNNKYSKTPLRDGMYANARIMVKSKKNVPIIPYSAVLDNEGEKYIFVVKEKTVKGKKIFYARKRVVETGIIKRLKQKDGEFIDFMEIKKGVSVNEFVVFMGHRFLQTNTKVEIRNDVGDKIIKSLVKADAFTEIPSVINSQNNKKSQVPIKRKVIIRRVPKKVVPVKKLPENKKPQPAQNKPSKTEPKKSEKK